MAPAASSPPETPGGLPPLPAAWLPRPPLLARLVDTLLQRRCVVLRAPAGFGKTTTLAAACRDLPADATPVWISCAAEDDLTRLVGRLLAALDPLDLPWRRSPEALMALLDGNAGPAREMADALVQALGGWEQGRGVIVVDDVQQVDDAALGPFLQRCIERLPGHWTLCLATRTGLPAGSLAAAGDDAVEWDVDALRFSLDDTRAWLGGDDDGRFAERLHALAQGWPAALALWRLHGERTSLDGPAVPDLDSRQALFAWLAREVLDVLPEALQAFVLRCAVLPQLQAARCAAVAGEPSAARWLHHLEARGLFVRRVGGAGEALQFDDLFREFLDEQLQQRRPDELPALLQRAADTEPDPVLRVSLLLRAGQSAAAAQALMDSFGALVARGEVTQVQRLLDRFAPGEREALAAWHYVQGRLAWLRWDWSRLGTSMDAARRGFEQQGWREMNGVSTALVALAFAGQGRLDEARAALHETSGWPMSGPDRAVVEHVRSWVAAGLGPAAVAAEAIDRMTEALQAGAPIGLWTQCVPNFRFALVPALGAAIDRFVDAALATAGESHPGLRSSVQLLRAWRRLDGADVAGARTLVAAVDDEARWAPLLPAARWSRLSLRSLLEAIAGDAARARDEARALVGFFPPGNPWRRVAMGWQLRVAWTLGDREAVPSLVDALQAAPAAGEWPFVPLGARLAQAARRLLEGQAAAAEAELIALQPLLEPVDTLGLLAQAWALLALARLRQGRGAAAREAVAPALQRGAVGLLTLGRPTLDELAAGLALDDGERARLDALRAAFAGAPAPAEPGGPGGRGGLSPREHDVLRALAEGHSNKVIARQLALSPHTVKRHVANIFDKLEVSTRAQAAVRYQALAGGPAAQP